MTRETRDDEMMRDDKKIMREMIIDNNESDNQRQ